MTAGLALGLLLGAPSCDDGCEAAPVLYFVFHSQEGARGCRERMGCVGQTSVDDVCDPGAHMEVVCIGDTGPPALSSAPDASAAIPPAAEEGGR